MVDVSSLEVVDSVKRVPQQDPPPPPRSVAASFRKGVPLALEWHVGDLGEMERELRLGRVHEVPAAPALKSVGQSNEGVAGGTGGARQDLVLAFGLLNGYLRGRILRLAVQSLSDSMRRSVHEG